MKILFNPDNKNQLIKVFEEAFRNSSEIYIATAFLTEWKFDIELGRNCNTFLAVVGTSFGLTRKSACESLQKWLPQKLKGCIYAYPAKADCTFHPKTMAWKSGDKFYALIGSSNMTNAAIRSKNFEINCWSEIDERQYRTIVRWFEDRQRESTPIDHVWLEHYREADIKGGLPTRLADNQDFVVDAKIENILDYQDSIELRRNQCRNFWIFRKRILTLLEQCSLSSITGEEFWKSFLEMWHFRQDDPEQFRFQGSGVERTCKNADWKQITTALKEVIEKSKLLTISQLDALVSRKIDSLAGNPARKAWFSEMLCQFLPDRYPVLNKPVREWIKARGWIFERGLSEGEWYIELSKRMRNAVFQNAPYVQNIAELDHVIWAIQGKNDEYEDVEYKE